MYSPKKVLERLESLSLDMGWTPEYHTLAEVDAFAERMKEVMVPEGRYYRQTRDFTAEEVAWMDNEYWICACDFDYWLTRYAYFKDSRNIIRKFEPRVAQQALIKLWGIQEDKGHSIEQQLLKGRQVGISTIIEEAIAHRMLFMHGINAVVGSKDAETAEKMNQMMRIAIEYCPWWMKPQATADRAGKYLEYGGNQCRLSIYSGQATLGMARGDTPTTIHLSECADYANAKQLIEDGLFNAIHSNPRVFLILESTGNGNTGWWAETWYSSRDHWDSGGARLQPVFLPWFVAEDLRPTPTWEQMHPMPEGWRPVRETRELMAKAAAYVHSVSFLRSIYGDNWTLPLRQAWYWEVGFLEARRKGNERGFKQELATDDIDALQSTKDRVFDIEILGDRMEERVKDYHVYGIIGESIDDKHHPVDDVIDWDRNRFRVTYEGKGKEYLWEFIPLKVAEDKRGFFDPDGKMLIFHPPEPGYDYSIGIDTAFSGSGDNCVISVMRKAKNMGEPDVQAAEWASEKTTSAEVHAFAMAIAAYYSCYMSDSDCPAPYGEPLVAAEQVHGPGDTCQLQMKLMGYRRFHKMSRVDGKDPKADKQNARKEGWYTFAWSRSFMLDNFKHAVENGWYILNSPFLIRDEMMSYVVEKMAGGKVRYDHEVKKHDDRIFGAAIAYIIANDTTLMADRQANKYVLPEKRLPRLDYGRCEMGIIKSSQIMGGFGNAAY